VPAELELAGRCTLAALPDDALGVHLEDGRGRPAVFPVSPGSPAGGDFIVRVPVSELTAGLRKGRLRVGPWTLALPPLPQDLQPAKWRRRGLPWYAKPVPGHGEEFALQVARTDLVRAVTGRFAS
jgi:CDP-glycerol glycerophosphotransferase